MLTAEIKLRKRSQLVAQNFSAVFVEEYFNYLVVNKMELIYLHKKYHKMNILMGKVEINKSFNEHAIPGIRNERMRFN